MSIEQKLIELREQWKNEPQNRSKIEMQVKVLKLGQNFPLIVEEDNPFINSVRKALS